MVTPSVGGASAVLPKLQAVHGDSQLEAQLLVIGDVRVVDKIDVADRHRGKDFPAKRGRHARRGFLDGLVLGRHLVDRHFDVFVGEVPVEAAGGEAVPLA